MFASTELFLPQVLIQLLVQIEMPLDFLLKSAALVIFASVGLRVFSKHLSNTSRHCCWLFVLVSLTSLPFLTELRDGLGGEPLANASIDFVELSLYSNSSEPLIQPNPIASGSSVDWQLTIILAYFLIALFFLSRLIIDALKLTTINRQAELSSCPETAALIARKQAQLNIRRPIIIKYSETIQSPLSFGLFRPVIIFPTASKAWTRPTFENALSHELSHIRRFDWLTSTAIYVAACCLWFNPFYWYALGSLNEESEACCDDDVLRTGAQSHDYAQDLVLIARNCKRAAVGKLSAQAMISQTSLRSRISRLLRKAQAIPENKFQSLTGMALASVILLGIAAVVNPLKVAALSEQSQVRSTDELWSVYRQFIADSTHSNGFTVNTGISGSTQMLAPRSIEFDPLLLQQPAVTPVPQSNYRQNRILARLASLASPAAHVRDDIELGTSPANIPAITLPVPQNGESGETGRFEAIAAMSKSQLRSEIADAESEFFRLFNAQLEDRKLAVHCADYRPAGTFIKEQFCEPWFVIEARSAELRDTEFEFDSFMKPTMRKRILQPEYQRLTQALNRAAETNPRIRELYFYLAELRSHLG